MDARLRPWSMWVDAHDHRARSVAAIDCDRLKAKTEIAAGDATLALEFWRHTFDRGRWYNKHAPAWPKYRHADRLTRHIKHEAAFGGSPQRKSSSILTSISPPRSDRQGPAARDTTPNAAVGVLSSAPTVVTSTPGATTDVVS
jgi:hypothetical protein